MEYSFSNFSEIFCDSALCKKKHKLVLTEEGCSDFFLLHWVIPGPLNNWLETKGHTKVTFCTQKGRVRPTQANVRPMDAATHVKAANFIVMALWNIIMLHENHLIAWCLMITIKNYFDHFSNEGFLMWIAKILLRIWFHFTFSEHIDHLRPHHHRHHHHHPPHHHQDDHLGVLFTARAGSTRPSSTLLAFVWVLQDKNTQLFSSSSFSLSGRVNIKEILLLFIIN